jgi:transcriptional regulator with XRE-family HTH domain
MITGEQIRAARDLLAWHQVEFARYAGLEAHLVESAEASEGEPLMRAEDLDVMRRALEAAGVEFTKGDAPAVRLRPASAGVAEG